MNLIADWRRVLKHAWSIRFSLLAALASAIDAGFAVASGPTFGHPVLIPIAVIILCLAGGVARLVRQKKISGNDGPDWESGDQP